MINSVYPRCTLSATHSVGDRKLLIRHGLGLLVDQNSASWNRVVAWLARLSGLRDAA